MTTPTPRPPSGAIRRALGAPLAPLLPWLGVAAMPVGCGGREPPPREGPPRVVASIHPVGSLAREVAGDAARIEVLLPPGAEPSTFELPARRRASLEDAAALLLVGGGLDGWAGDALPPDDGRPVVRLLDGVELRGGHEHDGDTGDPHLWLDPVGARDVLLPRIEALLAQVVGPDHRSGVRARAAAVADSLTALDAEIRDLLAPWRGSAFVATHGAWGYFADRYGLVDVGSVHPSPGREPSARGLAALVDAARAAGVRAVFTEPQLGETGARALAEELGVPVRVLDPLGGPGLEGREDYRSLLRFDAGQIAAALAGAAPGADGP